MRSERRKSSGQPCHLLALEHIAIPFGRTAKFAEQRSSPGHFLAHFVIATPDPTPTKPLRTTGQSPWPSSRRCANHSTPSVNVYFLLCATGFALCQCGISCPRRVTNTGKASGTRNANPDYSRVAIHSVQLMFEKEFTSDLPRTRCLNEVRRVTIGVGTTD